MIGFLASMGVFVLGVVSAVWSGFVLTHLWRWFVVPLGVVEISLPNAIGVSLIVGFLTMRVTEEDLKPSGDAGERARKSAAKAGFKMLYVAILFGLSWIVQLFM